MLSVIMILASAVIAVGTVYLQGINLKSVLSVTSYLTLGFISPILGIVLGIVYLYLDKGSLIAFKLCHFI